MAENTSAATSSSASSDTDSPMRRST
jgi:hypothetical protein